MNLKKNAGRVAAAVACVLPLTLGLGVAPALADTVSSDGITLDDGGAAVSVVTGEKDYASNSQFVATITVQDPNPEGCLTPGGGYRYGWFEGWAGDVSYDRAESCGGAVTFTVNAWVPSGSGVCGSFWRYDNITWSVFGWPVDRSGWYRHVACITISV